MLSWFADIYGLSMANSPVVIPSDRLSEDAKKPMHPFMPGHRISQSQKRLCRKSRNRQNLLGVVLSLSLQASVDLRLVPRLSDADNRGLYILSLGISFFHFSLVLCQTVLDYPF